MKLSLIGPVGLVAVLGRRFAVRVFAWRWTKPIARALLVASGLVLLAFLGRSTLAGAAAPAPSADIAGALSPSSAPTPATQVGADASAPPPVLAPSVPSGEAPPVASARHGPATPDDPVFLNQASMEDLRRLPGIGQKRALAILTLRAKVGRFRQLEDLMRVKGIGRATMKKLRPLVKLDPPPAPDAGAM